MISDETVDKAYDTFQRAVGSSKEALRKALEMVAADVTEEFEEIQETLPTETHAFGWITAPHSTVSDESPGEWYFGEDTVEASGIESFPKSLVTEWIPAVLVAKEDMSILYSAIYGSNVDADTVREFLNAVASRKSGV